MSDEVSELQREFRSSVLKGLDDLRRGQDQIELDVTNMRLMMVGEARISRIEKDVEALKITKTRLVTLFAVFQAAWFGILAYMESRK